MTTRRLDQLLVERGLFPSRQRAQGAIMAGIVFVADRRIDKAGTPVAPDAAIEVRGAVSPFVSRGGLKLAAALEAFAFDVKGVVAMDVGASTGGFTDCLLQAGAAKVYAVDVGYGQLAWTLRNDARVVVMERTNARHLTPEDIPERIDVIVTDVSFIGLGKIFPAIVPLLKDGGHFIGLVKPQFEAGRDQVGKRGVVRDAAVHERVLHDVSGQALTNGLCPLAVVPSPVTGPQGNVEFLLFAERRVGCAMSDVPDGWNAAVQKAIKDAEPLRR